MVIDSNRIKHIIAILKRHTMASGRSRSVTFEDERNDESSHKSDKCDDYFGEPSDDDKEEEAGTDHEDFSLLEQLLNEHDKAEGLSPSDWKDVELGNIQATVGEAQRQYLNSSVKKKSSSEWHSKEVLELTAPKFINLLNTSLDPTVRYSRYSRTTPQFAMHSLSNSSRHFVSSLCTIIPLGNSSTKTLVSTQAPSAHMKSTKWSGGNLGQSVYQEMNEPAQVAMTHCG
jgi:hypothetical protein